MKDTPFIAAMRADLANLEREMALRITVPSPDHLEARRRGLANMLDSIDEYPRARDVLLASRKQLAAIQEERRALGTTIADLKAELARAEASLATEMDAFGSRQLEARISGKRTASAISSSSIASLQAEVAGTQATLAAATSRAATADASIEAVKASASVAERRFALSRTQYTKLTYLQALEVLEPVAAAYQLAMRASEQGGRDRFEFAPSDQALMSARRAFEAELEG